MQTRQKVGTGAKWEGVVGYSRAVRVGNVIEVSGTAAVDENSVLVGGESAYEQTRFILTKIEKALQALGARLEDVVRTRIYVTDIERWEEVGRAHGERFGEIRPATSMVEVSALIDPEMLVEIEVTAVV